MTRDRKKKIFMSEMIDRATNVRMDGFILFHLKSKKEKRKKSHMRGKPETCRETKTAG